MRVVGRHCIAALNALSAQSMNQLVPSLGIPADLVLVFDGVSIGARQFSRYESLLLVWEGVGRPICSRRLRLDRSIPEKSRRN